MDKDFRERLEALDRQVELVMNNNYINTKSYGEPLRPCYNTPIRFDGDIIITDPCYIINRDNDDNSKAPAWWDFVTKTRKTLFEDKNGRTFTRYIEPKPEDYSDCRVKTEADYEDKLSLLIDESKDTPVMFSPTLKSEWDAYHKAMEAWQDVPHDDWERCNGGEEMEILGIYKYLSADTIYGDWSCTVFDSDSKEPIGKFCADSGMVGVFLLDEVLRYNPKFDYHTERKWTTTLIKDFHGTIMLKKENDTVTVVGEGNINFISGQTGF